LGFVGRFHGTILGVWGYQTIAEASSPPTMVVPAGRQGKQKGDDLGRVHAEIVEEGSGKATRILLDGWARAGKDGFWDKRVLSIRQN
jgi:hypothetical protein